jgi:zinc transport system ATP-binding protein
MTNANALTEKPQPAIEFCGLDFAYDRDLVLENASVAIPSRDFVAIVGPNGGGKTTMLKLLLGLLKPNRGTIRLLGKSPEQSRTSVGYTPQYIQMDMQFPISVFDVVLMGRMRSGRRFHWRYSQADKQAAKNALEIMRLSDKMKSPFRSLSGGQRQRALIARALCGEPKILMLDEPTNNIDSQAEEILYNILRELNKRLTILLVSHDLGIVSNIVKSVVCVNRTVAVHPTSELNGVMIRELYGSDVRFVRHDHRCSDHGR